MGSASVSHRYGTPVNTEQMYAMHVVDLVNIARQIRDGHGEEVAARIEEGMPAYLAAMRGFAESHLKTATFYAAGKLLKKSGVRLTRALAALVDRYSRRQHEALSKDCHKLARCGGGWRCIPWPTSLRPVDPNRTDPVGWRYIVDSKCGFKFPDAWKLCGNPLGLYQCEPPE